MLLIGSREISLMLALVLVLLALVVLLVLLVLALVLLVVLLLLALMLVLLVLPFHMCRSFSSNLPTGGAGGAAASRGKPLLLKRLP